MILAKKKRSLSQSYEGAILNIKIKTYPEDFIVDEILSDGKCASTKFSESGSGPFVWISIKKVNWNTIDLAREISRRLMINEKRVNYGGIKDRNAVTYQVFSINTKMDEKEVAKVIAHIKDVEVIGAWRSNRWIRSEDVMGNKFKIILRECKFRASDLLKNPLEKFPNYFGEQRFGSVKHNSAKVGLYLLKGDYKNAVEEYFSEKPFINDRERRMYEASRKMDPKKFVQKNWRLFKLCAHAFQSQLFNEELEMRIRDGKLNVLEGEYTCGRNTFGFADINVEGSEFTVTPLIGSKVEFLNGYKSEQLKKYGVTKEDFERLEIKGGWRTLYAPLVDLNARDLSEGCVELSFAIQRGSYATVALNEIIKSASLLS